MAKIDADSFDRFCMTRALELARRGEGKTQPNPAVGAVLARNQTILGQGYHKFYGGPHAEIAAFRNAKARGHSVEGATLYVTLEPCCHWGKTPPCSDAVIASGVKKVVVAAGDPSKKVAGKGLAALRHAGIDVRVGLLADEARKLNPWFYKFHETGRAWVICKWAQTLDGKLAARTGHSKWITGDLARQEAHRIRQTCQAIVVGVATVLADDPNLTVRLNDVSSAPAGPPNRVVLDSRLRTPLSSTLVRTAKEVPTWIFTTEKASTSRRRALERLGVRVVMLPCDKTEKISLKAFLKFAGHQNWPRIMVEGGAKVISSFLLGRLVDELCLFQAPLLALDDRGRQFSGQSADQVGKFIKGFTFKASKPLGPDVLLRFLRNW